MFTGSMSTILFMGEPSSTIVSSTIVSSPPSVEVTPVRGTTLIRCSFAKRRTLATSSVEVTDTTAAGIGPAKMPLTAWYFLNRSTLEAFSLSSSTHTWSLADQLGQAPA